MARADALLELILALKVLSSPVDPAKLSCVSTADGGTALLGTDGDWASGDPHAAAPCGRVQVGKSWVALVREKGDGQIYTRDFVWAVLPSADRLAVSGRQETEGRGGREERRATVSAKGVELTITRENPALEDAFDDLSAMSFTARESWTVEGEKWSLGDTKFLTVDGSYKDPKTGEWLFFMGKRVFYSRRHDDRAVLLKVLPGLTVQFPKGPKVVLTPSGDHQSVRCKGSDGEQTFVRDWF
ncbi:MAG: hypothetical protein IPJ65_34875 [Archangiaceae bacterium]|nr:hypothetical protein [Archangiaceae bacterium]